MSNLQRFDHTPRPALPIGYAYTRGDTLRQGLLLSTLILTTVALSTVLLYFVLVRPLKREVASLHADHARLQQNLQAVNGALNGARTELAKLDRIEERIEQVQRSMSELKGQIQSMERRLPSSQYGLRGAPSYQRAGMAPDFSGGAGSGCCGAALLVLLLIGGLGTLAGKG